MFKAMNLFPLREEGFFMPKELLNSKEIDRALTRIAHEILERNKGTEALCLIGIQRGGAHLSKRLASKIKAIEGQDICVGTLDITLYRDDLYLRKEQPEVRKTDITFSTTDKKIILIDDVFFTGRSIRAAMDALMDFGRPAAIQLAVLIDRGHRELPIRADYIGKNIPTSFNDSIEVYLKEEGYEDSVILLSSGEKL